MAIGTHDLDSLEGPFTYEALPPEQIQFAPLNQTTVMNGVEMMEFFEVQFFSLVLEPWSFRVELYILQKDMKIKSYLPIIRGTTLIVRNNGKSRFVTDSPVYPIIYDSKRRVLSMPPIINSDHSKAFSSSSSRTFISFHLRSPTKQRTSSLT